jgi:hypothetical protein
VLYECKQPLEAALAHTAPYTDASRTIYAWFLGVDTVFPLMASLLLALIFACLMLELGTPVSKHLLERGLALAPLFGAGLLDWLENICFAALVWVSPSAPLLWAAMGVAIKALKVGFLLVFVGGTLVLALILASRGLARRTRIATHLRAHHHTQEKGSFEVNVEGMVEPCVLDDLPRSTPSLGLREDPLPQRSRLEETF